MQAEIEKIRQAIGQRGEYLYFIWKELQEAGVPEAEKILAAAVSKWGKYRSQAGGELNTPADFIKRLESGNLPGVYEREILASSSDYGLVSLGFCPLVEAWRRLGASEEELALLCNIASEGDYALVGDKLKLEFQQKIATGDRQCLMKITPADR